MRYRRWTILVIGFPLYVALMTTLATVFGGVLVTEWSNVTLGSWVSDIVDVLTEPEFLAWALPITAGLAGLQIIFVLPLFANSPPRGQRSKSLTVSLLIAAAIAGLVCFAAGAALADGISLLLDAYADPSDKDWLWLVAVTAWLGGWGFWTMAVLLFTRRIWPDQVLGRIVGVLLGGTAVEMIAVIPLDVMVRRRTDCYCGTGTFWALVFSSVALLWLAGPGVVIALTTRRYRLWRTTHCGRCGYPMGPTPGESCPECGFEWESARGGRGVVGSATMPVVADAEASSGAGEGKGG